jgi:hypothetical protein
MTHIHWVTRQNKLEISRDKDEGNRQEIHECDGRAHDLDTMVERYCCARSILETKTEAP